MSKCRTLKDVERDPRIKEVVREYSGKGLHMAVCKDDYCFWGEASSSIGDALLIIDDVNNYLTKR